MYDYRLGPLIYGHFTYSPLKIKLLNYFGSFPSFINLSFTPIYLNQIVLLNLICDHSTIIFCRNQTYSILLTMQFVTTLFVSHTTKIGSLLVRDFTSQRLVGEYGPQDILNYLLPYATSYKVHKHKCQPQTHFTTHNWYYVFHDLRISLIHSYMDITRIFNWLVLFSSQESHNQSSILLFQDFMSMVIIIYNSHNDYSLNQGPFTLTTKTFARTIHPLHKGQVDGHNTTLYIDY